jgi:drug/metabolite transporter (DMT)-like permease
MSLAVLLTAVGQVLLKKGALHGINRHIIYSYINIHSISGGFLFLFATLCSLYCLRVLYLKTVIIFLPFVYIFVGLFSYVVFKENISKKQIIGAIFIIIGVVSFYL